MRTRVAIWVSIGVIASAARAPALGATQGLPDAGLPPQMWQRIQSALPPVVRLAPAESPQAPPTLSLTECVEAALRNDAGFRRDLADLANGQGALAVAQQRIFYSYSAQAQRERLVGGDTSSEQSASATARWERLGGDALNATIGTGTQSDFVDLLTQRPALSLTYDLPLRRGAGLAASAYERLRSARVGLASAQISFYEARQQLALRVIEDYLAVLLVQGEVEIAQRAVDRAQRFYEINHAKFTGEGLVQPGEEWVSQVAEIDVDQARLSWERAKQNLIRQQQAYRDALDRLLLDMGFRPGATPQLTTSFSYVPQDYDEGQLVATALANSSQLGLLKLAEQDAEASRIIAYNQAKPDLVLSAGVTDAGETLGGRTLSPGWFGGVRITVPLWERRLSEDKARADRSLAVLKHSNLKARDRVAQEVLGLVRAADAARARIAIGEQAVALARKNREQAQGMYEEGLTDYLRVLDADDRLVEAERSLLQEQMQYFLTTQRIRRALGEDITQGLPR